jgi:Subtilase family
LTAYKLRLGKNEIELSPSKTRIGVRPARARDEDARLAIGRALAGADWTDAGLLAGFRVVAIKEGRIDLDAALDEIRRDSAISVGTHVFELPQGRGLYVPTGDIYIEFAPGTSAAERQAVFDQYKLAIQEARGADGFVARVTPESPNPIKVAYALQQDPAIRLAEPDLASRAALRERRLPIDSLLREQWHLRNTGRHRGTDVGFVRGADARVLDAWEAAGTTGRADVVVAVIDDGFDLDHPDFAMPGKVVQPWDFIRRGSDPRPEEGDWHGTACAGVAVAATGGGNVVGAAPGCALMPVRWGPDLSDAQIEAWFDYVTRNGAAVVSCSWGAANPYFPLSTRVYRAIEACAKRGRGGRGCVIAFAAGNANRNINDPVKGTLDGFATHPDVIAVAASTSRDMRSNYSNYGAEISLSAPSNGAGGWGILTADVTGVDTRTGRARGYAPGDYTFDFGGTSSACPLVAGVAALVLSVNPKLTSAEVKRILQRTARKIGPPGNYDSGGHSLTFGYGCVDAATAVRAILPNTPKRTKRARPRRKAR